MAESPVILLENRPTTKWNIPEDKFCEFCSSQREVLKIQHESFWIKNISKFGMSCWLEQNVHLPTSIDCGFYSYGVSQASLNLGYFINERPSHNRIMKEFHYPVTHDGKWQSGNWAGSFKSKTNIFQDKTTIEKIFLSEWNWQIVWG